MRHTPTYYSAFIFLIGGEAAQAYDLRRGELAALRRSGPLAP